MWFDLVRWPTLVFSLLSWYYSSSFQNKLTQPNEPNQIFLTTLVPLELNQIYWNKFTKPNLYNWIYKSKSNKKRMFEMKEPIILNKIYWTKSIQSNLQNNTSLAKGALALRLQCCTACKIQNGRHGAPKWPMGSGKVFGHPKQLSLNSTPSMRKGRPNVDRWNAKRSC